MFCPLCKKELKKLSFKDLEIDRCSGCGGLWFEKEELRKMKDEKDKDLSWLDVDLWKQKTEFQVSLKNKSCPCCTVPLYEVSYAGSGIIVDFCSLCKGIWLDKGELERIVDYLKNRVTQEVITSYGKSLSQEIEEVFTGPEPLKQELLDVLIILRLLKYKLAAQFPVLMKIIASLPR